MRLRSGHLDENAIRQMLTSYMGRELEILDAKLLRRAYSDDDDLPNSDRRRLQIINQFAPLGEQIDRVFVGVDQLGIKAADREAKLRAGLIAGDFHNEDKARELAKRFGVKLHRDDQESLQLRLTQLDIRLAAAERAARQDADLDTLEKIREYQNKEKAAIKPRFYLGDAVDGYITQYDDPKNKVNINSFRAVKRETAFILMTLGRNMELAKFNSKGAITQLTKALDAKRKSTGKPLSDKTKSEYLKRMSSIVHYVIEKNELDVLNKIKGTHANVGSVKKRKSYGPADLKKLEDSLCDAPITYNDKPRNDRLFIRHIGCPEYTAPM